MHLNPSLASMHLYFKREDPAGGGLIATFLKAPDQPFEWNTISQDEFDWLRRSIVGIGYVSEPPDVAKIANQFVNTVVTLDLLQGLSRSLASPPEEPFHPSFDVDSQLQFFKWADEALNGTKVSDPVNRVLFLASCSILETHDTFRKLDLMDKIFEAVKGDSILEKAFISDAKRTHISTPGM